MDRESNDGRSSFTKSETADNVRRERRKRNNNMPAKKSSAKKSSSSKKSGATKSGAKKSSAKKVSSKRELITPNTGDSRYIRRDAKGRIKESDDVGQSLKQDRARKAKKTVKSGQGDKGDQKRK